MLVNLGPKWKNKVINTDHIVMVEPDAFGSSADGEIRIQLSSGTVVTLSVNSPITVEDEFATLKQRLGINTL